MAIEPLMTIKVCLTCTGQYAVLVLERKGDTDIARLRHVELGEVLGNAIAVLKGVKFGDRVVTSGANLVVDGEVVHVVS